MRIKIKEHNTKNTQYTSHEYEEVILESDGFMVRCKCSAIKEDETFGKEEKHFEYEDFYFRKFIESVTSGYANSEESYITTITMNSGEQVNHYFETMEEAIDLRDTILKWLRS